MDCPFLRGYIIIRRHLSFFVSFLYILFSVICKEPYKYSFILELCKKHISVYCYIYLCICALFFLHRLKIIQISSSTIELRIDSFERADHGTYGCWLRSSPSVKGVQIAVVFKGENIACFYDRRFR